MHSQHQAPCQGPCHTFRLSEVGPVLTPRHSRGSGDPGPVAWSQSPSWEEQHRELDLLLLGSQFCQAQVFPAMLCPPSPHPTPWGLHGVPLHLLHTNTQPSPAWKEERGGLPPHRPAPGPQTPPPSQPSQTPGGRKKGSW